MPDLTGLLAPGQQMTLVHSDARRDVYESEWRSPNDALHRLNLLVVKEGNVPLGNHYHVHPDYDCLELFMVVSGRLKVWTQPWNGGPVQMERYTAPAILPMPAGVAHVLVFEGPGTLVAITAWPYVDAGPDANTHRLEVPRPSGT